MEKNSSEDSVGIKYCPREHSEWIFPRGRWCFCRNIVDLITEATAISAVAFLLIEEGGRYERAHTLIIEASGGRP